MKFEGREFMLLAIAAIVVAAWMGRYSMTPATFGERAGGVYQLDRWTGNVIIYFGAGYRQTVPASPTP